MEEFASFLEVQTLTAGHLVFVGDFNYHVDDTSDYKTCQFIHLLDTFSLVQHISEPTHMSGHTLDLIITRSCESTVSDIIVYPYGIISDHSAINMKLQIIKPRLSKKVVIYRKTRSIDIQSFRQDVSLCGVVQSPSEDLHVLADDFHSDLWEILDKHAPQKQNIITIRPNTKWFNDNILHEKYVKS